MKTKLPSATGSGSSSISHRPLRTFKDLCREEPETHAWLQEWNTSGYVLEVIEYHFAEIELTSASSTSF